jgi:L-asparaginase
METPLHSPTPPLPRIRLLALGGTIASFGASAEATTVYELDPDRNPVFDAAAGLADLADVATEAVAHLISLDIPVPLVLRLSRRISALFAADAADGVVVSQGTDTLEETAWLLDLTLPRGRPVVMTGAMRPASAIGADGPANLRNAVRLAAHPDAAGQGVLVCLNDRIGTARSIAKAHTSALDAFQAPDAGFAGRITGERVEFFAGPPAAGPCFASGATDEVPEVEIVVSHLGMTGRQLDSALDAGVAGIVIAGTGNGSVAEVLKPGLRRARDLGIPVVRATRVAGGAVTTNTIDGECGCVPAGSLSPQKARLLLMLALRETRDSREIAAYFRMA